MVRTVIREKKSPAQSAELRPIFHSSARVRMWVAGKASALLQGLRMRDSSLSDVSPTDVSPAVELVSAEVSLRNRRDRLREGGGIANRRDWRVLTSPMEFLQNPAAGV